MVIVTKTGHTYRREGAYLTRLSTPTLLGPSHPEVWWSYTASTATLSENGPPAALREPSRTLVFSACAITDPVVTEKDDE